MKIIAALFLTALVLIFLYAQPYHVGNCKDAECYLYLLNRLTPALKGYKIKDFVLFRYNGKVEAGHILALGGDTLEITQNNINVNGQPFIKRERSETICAVEKTLKTATHHAFVFSDKFFSCHADCHILGPIPLKDIIGIAW